MTFVFSDFESLLVSDNEIEFMRSIKEVWRSSGGANPSQDDASRLLIVATENGCVEACSFLLCTCYASLSTKREGDGNCAVHIACLTDNFSLILTFLRYRGGVDALNNNGLTPLELACQYGSVRCVELLLTHSHGLGRATGGSNLIHTTLKSPRCQDARMLEKLVALGESPNGLDEHRNTPLHIAVKQLNSPAFHFLLRLNVKLGACNDEGRSPLHVAAHLSHSVFCSIGTVAASPNIDTLAEHQQHCLQSQRHCPAAVAGTLLRALIEAVQVDSASLTLLQCRDNLERIPSDYTDDPQLSAMLTASPQTRPPTTFVHCPPQNANVSPDRGLAPLREAIFSGDPTALAHYLKLGGNPAVINAQGQPLTHVLASEGHLAALQLLCRTPDGTKLLWHTDAEGKTALHHAAACSNPAVLTLLASSLTPGRLEAVESVQGQSAAHIAALHGNVAGLSWLQVRGSSFLTPDYQGFLPLHIALLAGQLAAVQRLLSHSRGRDMCQMRTPSGDDAQALAQKFMPSLLPEIAALSMPAHAREPAEAPLLSLSSSVTTTNGIKCEVDTFQARYPTLAQVARGSSLAPLLLLPTERASALAAGAYPLSTQSANGRREMCLPAPLTGKLGPPTVMLAHHGPLTVALLFGDGSKIATGAQDGLLSIWGIRTGEKSFCDYAYEYAYPTALAHAGSRELIYVGYSSGEIRGFLTGSWQAGWKNSSRKFKTQRGRGAVTSMALNPGCTTMAVAYDNGYVQLYDLQLGRMTAGFTPRLPFAGKGPVSVVQLAFSVLGNLLAVACAAGEVLLWQVERQESVQNLRLASACTGVQWSGNGRFLLASSLTGLSVFRTSDMQCLYQWSGDGQGIQHLSAAPHSAALVAVVTQHGHWSILNVETQQIVMEGQSTTVDWKFSCLHLDARGEQWLALGAESGRLEVWNLQNGFPHTYYDE
jgi:ankyrin repeat protein